jgi:(R,R)-butanediol dehydrogenase / meso-butanediol dehydrogenase / diacetyl reductase
MKAIIYRSDQNKAEFVETKEPQLDPEEALIKVKYAGICGADINLINGERKITSDVIPGHEIIGKVVEVKGGEKNLIGKRVAVEPTISCEACQMCKLDLPHICYNLKVLGVQTHGGMAEYVKAPVKKLHIIPDNITDEQAAIMEPLAVAVHIVRRSRLEIGDRVIIIGGGPIGLLVAQVCRVAGAGKIIIVELNAFRNNLCKELGFDIMNPGEIISEGEKVNNFMGFDIGFEVSGSNSGMKQILNNIRSRGRVVVVGLFKESFPIEFSQVLFKELEIIGSRVYESRDFKIAMEMISENKIDCNPIVTNILKLEDFKKAFELASNKNAMKVILKTD